MKHLGWSLIQITLILLKAFEVIDWSWFWVLFPMWIGLAIMAFVLGVALLLALLTAFGKRY